MAEIAVSGVAPRRLPQIELQALLYAAVLLTLLFLVLFPVVMLVLYSFSVGMPGTPLQLGFEGWARAIADPVITRSVLNSVKVLLAIHGISFPVAILIAWILARTDLPGRDFFEFMFWISFFMPSLAILLGWILCLDPEYGLFNVLARRLGLVQDALFDIYTFWGIVWAHLVSHTISVKVMLLTPTFRNIDSSLEEAAEMSGASRLATMTRIILPVTLPALLAILLLAMIRAMQSFEIEMVLGPPFRFYIFGTQVYRLIGQEPPDYAGASALASIGLMIITPLILLQRYGAVRRSYTTISGKMRTDRVRLGAWRLPVFLVLSVVVAFLIFLPLSLLVLASCMSLFGFFDVPKPFTLDHWLTVFSDTAFRGALANTIAMAGGASVFAIVLLSLVAYFSVRTTYPGRSLLDFLSWLPYAVPGILFGLGLLYVFLELPLFRPFYGTIWLMILASVISHITLGTQIFKSNLLQLGRELEEVARTSGASWLQTMRRIVMPIMVPALLLVGATAFISAARDVASVALVATAGTKTLSLLQLDYMIQGRYGAAAVISFVVVMLSTGLALIARLFGLRIGMRH
jgi:iron(III) transport system permease protein